MFQGNDTEHGIENVVLQRCPVQVSDQIQPGVVPAALSEGGVQADIHTVRKIIGMARFARPGIENLRSGWKQTGCLPYQVVDGGTEWVQSPYQAGRQTFSQSHGNNGVQFQVPPFSRRLF